MKGTISALLLGAIRPERLRNYEDRIQGLHRQYGESAWPIIYQADVRCRSEELDRLRRMAESPLQAGPRAAGPVGVLPRIAVGRGVCARGAAP